MRTWRPDLNSKEGQPSPLAAGCVRKFALQKVHMHATAGGGRNPADGKERDGLQARP